MYNPELKERFIRDATSSENTAQVFRNIFAITESFEEEARKDVCQMDDLSGKKLAEAITNIRGNSIEKRLSLVKQYVRWCVRNGIEGATLDFLSVRPVPYKQIWRKMVSGPLMMRNYLDAVFDPPDEMTAQNTLRCYLWLGFMGLPADFVFNLKSADVDLVQRKVSCGGIVYDVPDDAMPEMRNCATLTGFYRIVSRGNANVMVPRASGSLLLRGVTEDANLENMKIRIAKLEKNAEDAKKTDKRLSYEYARLSGFFFRMQERAMAGDPVCFREEAERLEEESARLRAGNKQDVKSVQIRIASRERGLMADYERWRIAFLP